MKHHLDFYTQYNQFYISDKTSPKNTGDDNFWTTIAFNDRLALGERILGVGIGSYGHVRCKLETIKNISKNNNFDKYDHIVEGGIEIKSGILQVFNCPTSEIEIEIKLKPGTYRVRIYSLDLKNTVTDEYEGTDHYEIEIWPSSDMERRVLKQYVNNH